MAMHAKTIPINSLAVMVSSRKIYESKTVITG
jgi:hypothetical protein